MEKLTLILVTICCFSCEACDTPTNKPTPEPDVDQYVEPDHGQNNINNIPDVGVIVDSGKDFGILDLGQDAESDEDSGDSGPDLSIPDFGNNEDMDRKKKKCKKRRKHKDNDDDDD